MRRGGGGGSGGRTEDVLEGLAATTAADHVGKGAGVGGGALHPSPLERSLPLAQVCGKSGKHKGGVTASGCDSPRPKYSIWQNAGKSNEIKVRPS
jgi:hypothetical protein